MPAPPPFEAVYKVGLPFLRQALRWLGIAKHDIDDVAQDILIAAYRSLDTYRPVGSPTDGDAATDPSATGDIPQIADAHERHLKRWLFGIAWRQVTHHRERAFRRREIAMGAGATWSIHPLDPGPNSDDILAGEQQGHLVGRLLDKLPPDGRLLLIQHDLLDVPLADIARENEVNENTLRNRLRLARAGFRRAVKRMNLEDQLALGGAGKLTFAELTRSVDPDELLRETRTIPEVPEWLRGKIWSALERALAGTEEATEAGAHADASAMHLHGGASSRLGSSKLSSPSPMAQ